MQRRGALRKISGKGEVEGRRDWASVFCRLDAGSCLAECLVRQIALLYVGMSPLGNLGSEVLYILYYFLA